MSEQDMTPSEAREALRILRVAAGQRSWTNIYLQDAGSLWQASFYPLGMEAGQPRLSSEADLLRDAITQLQAEWINFRDQHFTSLARRIALRIITITAEQGACTDAALRMTGDFTDTEIAAHGAAACEEANRLASNGPFSITTTSSNQQAA